MIGRLSTASRGFRSHGSIGLTAEARGMSVVRSVLLRLEVRQAGRASKCARNKNHAIAKGQPRFVVKNHGPAQGEKGYCKRCAKLMISRAHDALDGLEADLS